MQRRVKSVTVSNITPDLYVRIAGITHESIVDGPGIRTTVFLQGCPHKCLGCHNPETHAIEGGREVSLLSILTEIQSDLLSEGVTFSGGEPFLQAPLLIPLLAELKEAGRHLMAYSGYRWESLLQEKNRARMLSYLDVLVDGPYLEHLRTLDEPFRGSSNQRVIDVPESLSKGRVVLLG